MQLFHCFRGIFFQKIFRIIMYSVPVGSALAS